jgi:SAM-dependent methyltransferase
VWRASSRVADTASSGSTRRRAWCGRRANGDGTRLPFADATFDVVVAYNSLQTMAAVPDMARAVREAGRVVRPGGSFCVCVAHPMTDMALVNEASGGEIAIAGSYFDHRRVDDTVTSKGLTMRFSGWTYTIGDYARALEDTGFVIERVREPQPRADADRRRLERWHASRCS